MSATRSKHRRLFWLWFGLTASLAFGAEPDAVLKGKISDEQGVPLYGANIVLKENYAGSATNADGFYQIKTKPGEFTLEITFVGYEKISEKIYLKSNAVLTRNFRLKIESFKIGGIVVVAEKELLPSQASTTTTISSGEIEHIQASSLSDVMKLVPGQRFENPGLQSLKQVSIRTSSTDTDADRNATFGTSVIVDGVPISNNSNMQVNTYANSGTVQRTTENSGIDLRQIPADNIAEVEVIRGIPSARYGDLASGIVKVQTKSESLQQRFKYKYNLQNQELNLNGGTKIAGQIINYNLNYANSVRDVRIDDYDYSRISGQLSHIARFFGNLYTLDNKIYYTRAFDEQGLIKGDVLLTERYNRDYVIRYNHNSKFILTPTQKLEFAYALNYTRQNSYSKKLLTADNTYISDRMTEGTQEGVFFKTDTTEIWVKGRSLNHYSSIDYNSTFNIFKTVHNFLVGANYRIETNNGQGRIFDPLHPPYLTSAFRDRPRSYDDLPALRISSFYLEDKITGSLLIPYTMIFGLRTEAYGTGDVILSDNRGLFFNPRFNFTLTPRENTQIRLGYGVTSKAPSLSMLYPNLTYYDLADVSNYVGVDSLNQVIVSTYIYNPGNPKLKGYQQFKRELSFDQRIGGLGFSLTGYTSSVYGGFANTLIRPVALYQYDYPNWPDTTGKVITDSIYTSYSVMNNSQNQKTYGLEFSVQTRPLTDLKVKLRIEGAYNLTDSHQKGYDYSSTYLRDTRTDQNVKPFWNVVDTRAENLLINYKLEFTIKELGAWITCEAQQVIFDKYSQSGLNDSIAVGYITNHGEFVYFAENERTPDLPDAFKRIYADYWSNIENQKNIWVFNLRVSKSLSKGSEVSFYVNNIFNSHPLYKRRRTTSSSTSYVRLNPDLYFGVEFSGIFNDLWK
ncbi:MAG: TonB-dependent receptor [Candidatus Neomarinimicrobiota bacterium]